MFGATIMIPREATTISLRPLRSGGLRITYPRWGHMTAGLAALAAGAAFWLCRLPADAWQEPLEYALGALLLSPGMWGIGRALRPRTVLRVSEDELAVRHGPAFFERVVARLPLETLEVQTFCHTKPMIRYDSHVLSRRLLAAFVPVPGGRPRRIEAPLYTLQVRNGDQTEWLSVLGSPVASEVENARLAIAAARPRRVLVEAEPDSGADDVNPSHGSP